MERRIASPALKNDPGSRALIDLLERVSTDLKLGEAVVYYDFPMFRDDRDELLRSRTMFASPEIGVIFLAAVVNAAPRQYALEQADAALSELYSLAFGRLLKNSRLRRDRQELLFPIRTCVYNPEQRVADDPKLESDIATSQEALRTYIQGLRNKPLPPEIWRELISTIEGASALRREKEKGLASAPKGSRGAILNEIYSRIASFDQDQRRAAIALVDGPQRIRGIAGSGKTVVLAMKAAHIHLVKPESKLLVTFWTKSLYDQFKYLISKFYRQFSERDPDWDRVHVLHAWGGKSTNGGVYFDACVRAGQRPLTLADIKRLSTKPAFGDACRHLLAATKLEQFYDYVLIDEGQDLEPAFYQLCFEVAKGGAVDRNVIWAYDELQNILNVEIQSVAETFGVLADGRPRVDLARAENELSAGLQPHDIVLKRSYRNPAEVLRKV